MDRVKNKKMKLAKADRKKVETRAMKENERI